MNELLSLFLNSNYFISIYISIIIAFVIVLSKPFRKTEIKEGLLKITYFIIFLPVATIPLIKCYFKVPYIFCKACPRKCVFGELRPIIIPAFLFLNLDKRAWCYKLCPCGTFQDYQTKLCKKRIKLPKWLFYFRYLILLFTIIIVLLIIFDENFKNPFFVGAYKVIITTLIAASVIFILCLFIPRFWCNYFCPIGSFGDLAIKIENK